MDLADPLLTVPETHTPRVGSGWQWILEDHLSSMKTEKNQRISGDFCWKIICSHGNRRWRRSVLPQAGGAPCPTFTRQGEQWHGDNGYSTCDRRWLMSWPQWISTLVQSLPFRHHSLGWTGSQMREQEDNGKNGIWSKLYGIKRKDLFKSFLRSIKMDVNLCTKDVDRRPKRTFEGGQKRFW